MEVRSTVEREIKLAVNDHFRLPHFPGTPLPRRQLTSTYYDTAGTPDPADDLDRIRLEESLNKDLPQTDSVKLDFTVRRIDVSGDEAQAEVFYDQYYRVKTPTTTVPRRDSDVQRLKLRRIDGQWKFVSGL